uniref:Ribosomal protein S14 n=1 Tax=Heterosigma akashiwo TaxID=2829 RepID=D2Z270_HETAK|nr:ribosomal protein S14 [Heterosigma akashiwo]BAI70634.1 ribosomal protein S14 [Heterosigma akashiwo]BBB45738.1 ribosomal protein S14 [Heterosigma akashiwo]BBB45776.1 ribosomal protein S14 [Heterosigma akashiwo]BBE28088.1 ribosomal protein S14 [Heterosigma akashiwo]
MKSKLAADLQQRERFKTSEITQKILKSLSQNQTLPTFQQWWVKLNQTDYPKNARVRIKNRCVLTGRSASVSRNCQLSRIQFRELGRSGCITGLQKSSW